MTKCLTLIALYTFILSGCACAKNTTKTSAVSESGKASSTEVKVPAATPAPTKAQPATQVQEQVEKQENPCRGERTEYKGKVTLKGQVGSTKGAQLTLRGLILRMENPREARHWIGKNVTATGDHCVYTCGPMEQCLMGGTIPTLRNVTISELPPTP